jgi:outer membrane immunogenic protein
VDWTGYYIGGNFGYGIGRAKESVDVGSALSFTRLAPEGMIAGGQAGYRFQYNWLVVGAETDFQWSGQKSSSCIFNIHVGCLPIFSSSRSSRLDWLGTVRGVAGIAQGNSLWYVTGGLAYGSVVDEAAGFSLGLNLNGSALTAAATERKTMYGWAVGTGVETRLGASNWSVKAEYLYVDLGRHTFQPQCAGTNDAQGNRPGCEGTPSSVAAPVNIASTDHIVRVGLNYSIGARPAPTPAPSEAAAPANWAGFYVGGNFGYGIGHDHIDSDRIQPTGIPGGRWSVPQSPVGIIGGGQAGYRFQHDWAVLGAEADFQWSGQEDNSCSTCAVVAVTFGAKRDWFGTVRGVAGIAQGNSLWYVTGGYAYGRVDIHQEISFVFGAGPPILASSQTTKSGWTAGAGVETKLWASNWSAKLEYLYVNLGDVSFYGTCSALSAALLGLRNGICVADRSTMADHIVRVGVNYRFGG